jgi:hypothetical protein
VGWSCWSRWWVWRTRGVRRPWRPRWPVRPCDLVLLQRPARVARGLVTCVQQWRGTWAPNDAVKCHASYMRCCASLYTMRCGSIMAASVASPPCSVLFAMPAPGQREVPDAYRWHPGRQRRSANSVGLCILQQHGLVPRACGNSEHQLRQASFHKFGSLCQKSVGAFLSG